MATGTGVTGLIAGFPNQMLVQLNHGGAIDEAGKLRSLGRLHIDLTGNPFANSTSFHMEHDLRRSLIIATAQTATGVVRVEIRAHRPLDVIRLDVYDQRDSPGTLDLHIENDSPCETEWSEGSGRLVFWHENPQSTAVISSVRIDALSSRAYGACLSASADGRQSTFSGGHLVCGPAIHYVIQVAGAGLLGGKAALVGALASRMDRAAAMDFSQFVSTHESWWRDFWERSYFEPDDSGGKYSRYRAAFDLYRYYMACCASECRECPPRFQIDLYRYHLRQNEWLTYMISSVEQYQSLYGALRTGDWEALRCHFSFYRRNMPYFREFARAKYGKDGATIPMGVPPLVVQNPVGAYVGPVGVQDASYNWENPAGSIWLLGLMCDYSDITGDTGLADATLRPMASDILKFMRQQYPVDNSGKMVIFPCNAGETWQYVTNPSELVCAFRALLPKLIRFATTRGWTPQGAEWAQMLETIPEVPTGTLTFDPAVPTTKPDVGAGQLLVPAQDMSGCHSYVLPYTNGQAWYNLNWQQTEMYAVWPAKLVLSEQSGVESARQSYLARMWQHRTVGWALDVVFAACLGLDGEVSSWFDTHFGFTYVLPCGLAQEDAPTNPACTSMPECPSLHGMGTGMIPVLEMLLQDRADQLVVLPCWPKDVGVRYALYSPLAGRVEVDYRPDTGVLVRTERKVTVVLRDTWAGNVRLLHRVGKQLPGVNTALDVWRSPESPP